MKILREPLQEALLKEVDNLDLNNSNIHYYIESTIKQIIKEKMPDWQVKFNFRGSRYSTIEKRFDEVYLRTLMVKADRHKTYQKSYTQITEEIRKLMDKIDDYT